MTDDASLGSMASGDVTLLRCDSRTPLLLTATRALTVLRLSTHYPISRSFTRGVRMVYGGFELGLCYARRLRSVRW